MRKITGPRVVEPGTANKKKGGRIGRFSRNSRTRPWTLVPALRMTLVQINLSSSGSCCANDSPVAFHCAAFFHHWTWAPLFPSQTLLYYPCRRAIGLFLTLSIFGTSSSSLLPFPSPPLSPTAPYCNRLIELVSVCVAFGPRCSLSAAFLFDLLSLSPTHLPLDFPA